jgi:CheY-like chemotaxis protein
MEHLFEPFFTTREDRAGTGLGLAVVHGVISEMGGAIDVQSLPDRGARFTLLFPERDRLAGASASDSVTVPRGSGQKLLLIDDEPLLVAMGTDVLKGLGYDAIGYSDPERALLDLEAHPDRFAAVITDEMMPGMSGTELTEKLRRWAPHLPVLLVTGYGGALLAARAATAGVTRILAKPLRRSELAGALADLVR